KDFLVILKRQDSRLGDYKPVSLARRSFCSAQYRRRHIDLNWSRHRKRDDIKRSAIAAPNDAPSPLLIGRTVAVVRQADVRFWHIADSFRHRTACLLSGAKRTLFPQPNMSANDP